MSYTKRGLAGGGGGAQIQLQSKVTKSKQNKQFSKEKTTQKTHNVSQLIRIRICGQGTKTLVLEVFLFQFVVCLLSE